jgi:5'-AMP-activated protein kinase catalytic alpha subunit
MAMISESTELGVVIEISRQFGKYTYVRTIGSAASSVVLLVVDRSGQQYAAKVVKREFLIADSNLEYFEREIRLLQFIRHPNIVQLHEILYQTDNIIVIMEFCEQGDLFDHLGRNGALPTPTLRSFIYQLLKALQCLHDKGFAHRDLKPENILVCSDTLIKIADLGLARPVPPDGMMTTICGSMHYMAPEILQEMPYDGTKADIWAFGIIVFAMALNQLPWGAQDRTGLIREIIRAQISYPVNILPEVARMVQLCTKKNPQERPTATELLDLPWISEEVMAYNRLFGGLSGKISMAALQERNTLSMPKMPSVTKSTAKMILSKPNLRKGERPVMRDGKLFVNLPGGN